MEKMKKLNLTPKLAVVGCGYWGKNIVRNLHELGVLEIVCDKNPHILKAAALQYPTLKTVSDYEKLFEVRDIDAIVIASPAPTHYILAKKAILANKDVFVEKPLSLTVREAEELVRLAHKKNRILMVGHILQYHPVVRKLKEMLEGGELGKLQYIYSNRLNIGKLRTEENILWSFAPHDISVILMLLGEEPARVSSFGGTYITKGVYDTTLTVLEFKNGIMAHIFVSWLHPFKEQKLIVVGSKAMAVFDDLNTEKLFIYPHTIEYLSGKIPVAQKAEHVVVPVENKEPLKEELRHFIECICSRKQPLTDGIEGVKVLKVLEQAEAYFASTSKTKNNTTQDNGVFVHESAYIDEGAHIGEGTQVWHFSHILKGSRVGAHCKIGQNVVIGPRVTIGNGCKIQNNVSIYEGVALEDEVFCGPSCVFTNVFNPRSAIPRMAELKITLIKQGATIGANATIICGHTIGKYAFIGAGAVVTKDVSDYALVTGVPARQIGWACKCGTKLIFTANRAQCSCCGDAYLSNKAGISLAKGDAKNKEG